MGSCLGAAAALEPVEGAVGSMVLASVYGASTFGALRTKSGSRASAFANALSYPGFYGAAALIVRTVRRLACDVDLARGQAVTESARAAAQQARLDEHRLLHDSALQTLEAIATYDLDVAEIKKQARREALRLRRSISGDAPSSSGLSTGLNGLAQEYAIQGLNVELVMTEARRGARAKYHGCAHGCAARVAPERRQARGSDARRGQGGPVDDRTRIHSAGSWKGLRTGLGDSRVRDRQLDREADSRGRRYRRDHLLPGARDQGQAVGAPVIRVAVVEDHPLYRQGLLHVIESDPTLDLVGAASAVAEMEGMGVTNVEVVILDLHLPDAEGAEAVRRIKALCGAILIVSASEDRRSVVDAIAAGARGYLTKSSESDEISRAVHAVARGGTYVSPLLAAYLLQDTPKKEPAAKYALTDREHEILSLLAEGERDADIAERLFISIKTVQSHLDRIRDKTGKRRRAELAKIAFESQALHEHS